VASGYNPGAMNRNDRISINPEVLLGKPVITGTRLSVEFLVGLLAQGWTFEQILENYPGLSREDILAALEYARDRLACERVYPLAG